MSVTEQVGSTDVAMALFAGRYEEVLARTIDSSRGGARDVDVAFVVGALSFVGRIVEAELLLESVRPERSEAAARTHAAGGFFLAVAHCRAGNVDRGREAIVRAERATRGARDAWCRSLLWQGLACCHYFASDYRRAERATLDALRSGQAAQLAYAQLLANDMRGHLLLRRGRVLEGITVLERAKRQAEALEFRTNAHAIAVSIDLARASVASTERAIATLEARLEQEQAQDGYSRRMILLELATRLAWSGEASRARDLLDEAAPLCAGDDRAQVSLLCARAQLARVREGWAAARALAERAAALLPRGADVAREAEVAALVLGAALWERDEAAAEHAAEWLRQIADEAGLYRADVWLAIHGQREVDLAESDEAAETLREVARGSLEAALRARLLGLVPELGGRSPGRRLHVLEDAVLVEDHGEVSRLPGLSPRCRDVLEAIRRGDGTRERMLAAVWGIRSYRPERHDSVIKTTVSRLRSSLGHGGRWIVTDGGDYRLAGGVEVVRPDRLSVEPPPDAVRPSVPRVGRRAARWRRVLDRLARVPEATVSELAREVGTSVRTMSRDLSELCSRRLVSRSGAGPATRYRATLHSSEVHEAMGAS